MNKKLITQVMQGMLGALNNAQLEKLQYVMEHALYGKEVVEKQPEDIETSNEQLLQSFLAAKRIEGCSEKSLTYYKATIETSTYCRGYPNNQVLCKSHHKKAGRCGQ